MKIYLFFDKHSSGKIIFRTSRVSGGDEYIGELKLNSVAFGEYFELKDDREGFVWKR
jgi:hypothetical protein